MTHDQATAKQLTDIRRDVLRAYPDEQLFLWLKQISPYNVKGKLNDRVFKDRIETVDRIREHTN